MNPSDITEFFQAHRQVVERSAEALSEPAAQVARVLVERLAAGNKVIACGNGGSATEASHLVGELIGRFKQNRQPFPAVSLASDLGAVTCIGNDFGYDALFERQTRALAQPGDIFIGLTTSGRSANVLRAFRVAGERGAITVALTGAAGLTGADADHVLAVPSDVTAHIQEVHLMLLHVWCIHIDAALGKAE